MKRALVCLFTLLFTLVATAGERIGDFALLDSEGAFHQMSWYDDHKAVVFLIQSNGCEVSRGAIPAYKKLRNKYQDQGVEFLLLNPEGVDRELVQAEAAEYGMEFPILMDDAQLVAESLGITAAGGAIVFDPASFEIIYQGPVEDYLEIALSSLLESGRVEEPSIEFNGCSVSFAVQEQHQQNPVSYSNDIAPLIAENCAECHRINSIAPFALDSHQIVQGWAPMIKEVVMTKRMPPGQIDPHIGNIKEMANLTDSEAQKLIHWIDAGAPKDGEVDLLAELTWPDTKWRAEPGTVPDLIVKIPPQEIPATGVVDYMRVYADIALDKDRYIRGSELIPGDYSVLHHVITRVIQPETDVAIEPEEGDAEVFASVEGIPLARISGYVPGRRPKITPNSGGLLRKGSRLSMQMHYTTSGRAITDTSEIGIYFYPEGVIPTIEKSSGGRALNRRFVIPANAKDHEVIKSAFVEKDAYLVSFMPHMHFRGKRMKFIARYPDGTEETILSVPHYQFNWQIRHELAEPKFVPAGTEMIAVGAFDNSTQNRFNPDPAQDIDWGPQSWDEMFIGYMRWQNVEDILE